MTEQNDYAFQRWAPALPRSPWYGRALEAEKRVVALQAKLAEAVTILEVQQWAGR